MRDKADMGKPLLPADRIAIGQDNVASADTDMRGDVMSLKPRCCQLKLNLSSERQRERET